jgi:hypothetical protein
LRRQIFFFWILIIIALKLPVPLKTGQSGTEKALPIAAKRKSPAQADRKQYLLRLI